MEEKNQKKSLKERKRNYTNCISCNNSSLANTSGSKYKFGNRREWNNKEGKRCSGSDRAGGDKRARGNE